MTLVEKFHERLRAALVATVVAFCCWQVPMLVMEWVPVAPLLGGVVNVVATLGSLAWGVSMWRLYRVRAALRMDPHLRASLNDERTRQARTRALALGFVVLTLYLAVLRVGAFLLTIPLGLAAQFGIFLAVVVSIVAFLVLEYGGGAAGG